MLPAPTFSTLDSEQRYLGWTRAGEADFLRVHGIKKNMYQALSHVSTNSLRPESGSPGFLKPREAQSSVLALWPCSATRVSGGTTSSCLKKKGRDLGIKLTGSGLIP